MIAPILKFDSDETYYPRPVEVVEAVAGATVNGQPIDVSALPPHGGRMSFPDTMTDAVTAPYVGYHRVALDQGLYWSQFWFWYLYNPAWILNLGAHQGDWEFVQLGCVDQAGDHPVLVTGSEHQGGGKREFWRCELQDGRPVIYVARGSHAHYFNPGVHGDDIVNGQGRVLDAIEWRAFGGWAGWPGFWGATTGDIGRSPESPGRQGVRWWRPATYHGRAT